MTKHLNLSQRLRLATTAASSFRKGMDRQTLQAATLGEATVVEGVATLRTISNYRNHLGLLVARILRRLLLVLRLSLITEISPTTVEVTLARGRGLRKLTRFKSSAIRTALSGEHGV